MRSTSTMAAPRDPLIFWQVPAREGGPFIVEARACATAKTGPVSCTLVLREADALAPAGA